MALGPEEWFGEASSLEEEPLEAYRPPAPPPLPPTVAPKPAPRVVSAAVKAERSAASKRIAKQRPPWISAELAQLSEQLGKLDRAEAQAELVRPFAACPKQARERALLHQADYRFALQAYAVHLGQAKPDPREAGTPTRVRRSLDPAARSGLSLACLAQPC